MVWAAGGTSVVCVQPQEPTAGPVPMAGVPGPGVPVGGTGVPQKPRNRRTRLILVMIAGIVGLLCLGGVGVAISVYDDATKIDRSDPDTVADSFLIAYLVNRDDKAAQLFTCESADLTNLNALREQLVAREKKFNVKVSVSWGALARAAVGPGQEDVSTELTISGSTNGQVSSSRNEEWRFRVVDSGGSWRVCNASKEP